MRYNLAAFNSAVKYYEKALKAYRGKTVFIAFESSNDGAFFSLAPLSRALHNMRCDVSASLFTGKSEPIEATMELWAAYADWKDGVKSEKTRLLGEFITLVDKKAKGEFEKIFKAPELLIDADDEGFITSDDERLEFHTKWFRKFMWNDLMKTARIIWKQTYDLKKSERVGMGFDLIARADLMKNPLQDYFDSYAVARTMFLACPAKKKTMKAVTSKMSMFERGERASELSMTMLGCELEKDINEPIFRSYRKLSKALKLDRFRTNTASFYVKGEGYGGRHIFGEVIGYPTPNLKSRWDSVGGMIYQFPWYPQTKIDGRGPKCRLGFTDTVPIDKFIEACNIDWMAMTRKDDKLIAMAMNCDKIMVESKWTNLEVGLVKPDGDRRELYNSDTDIREMHDRPALRRGIKAGNMGNIPAGEMFMTPEYVKGTVYGDVLINIERSIVLLKLPPLVVECLGDKYRIISGPKHVIKRLNDKRNEAMRVLLKQAKQSGMPKPIVELKKKNFDRVGEFAINTNPKASLSNYLITNEKIAGMIHVAFGSGFEADRLTVYHYDTVINAKKQKLDIYGLNSKTGKKYWMMRQGKLLVK